MCSRSSTQGSPLSITGLKFSCHQLASRQRSLKTHLLSSLEPSCRRYTYFFRTFPCILKGTDRAKHYKNAFPVQTWNLLCSTSCGVMHIQWEHANLWGECILLTCVKSTTLGFTQNYGIKSASTARFAAEGWSLVMTKSLFVGMLHCHSLLHGMSSIQNQTHILHRIGWCNPCSSRECMLLQEGIDIAAAHQPQTKARLSRTHIIVHINCKMSSSSD